MEVDLHGQVRRDDSPFFALRRGVEEAVGQRIDDDDFVGQCVQTMLLLRSFDVAEGGRLSSDGPLRNWLIQQRGLDWSTLLLAYARWSQSPTFSPIGNELGGSSRGWDDYGPFLARFDPGRRNKRGVFFTPQPVAAFVIAEVDRILRDEWRIPAGLALLCQPACGWTLTDPAVGSAVFLCAAIQKLAAFLEVELGAAAKGGKEFASCLRPAVEQLQGRDVLLPACALAHLRIAIELQRIGYCLEDVVQIDVRLANSLQRPSDELSGAASKLLIVGNPPFSGISQNRNPWIDSLMRETRRGYYSVDGERLKERKLWLSDDYVKFFRVAQDNIERAGEGVLAFVTNQAMIDNATFRGMRWSLQQTFNRHTIVDLHGNRKRNELDLQGQPDQNVFEIEQGVAICLMRRHESEAQTAVSFEHAELFGARDEKLAMLQACATENVPLPRTAFGSSPPHFLLSPSDECDRFQLGLSLPDLFPVNSTAPVTARDRVVVAHTPAELLERIGSFRDLSLSDADVRAALFGRKLDSLQRHGRRQREYELGDTRGWRLAEARRQIAADPAWRNRSRACLYRPFDVRSIYWTPTMIDWPRPAVSKHLCDGNNLVLISRRLRPPKSRGVYLWACTGLALDGVIRSDNRGSESLFPMLLRGSDATANIDSVWLESLALRCQLDYAASPRGDLTKTFGTHDVAGFVYAQLQSPRYLNRFAGNLRQEFPRVFLPHDRESFVVLSSLGHELLDCHLAEQWGSAAGTMTAGSDSSRRKCGSQSVLQSPYPIWADGCVQIGEGDYIESVRAEVWEFHVGSHQVCCKWLKDRRGRCLSATDRVFYRRILNAIEATLALRAAIPGDVDEHGSWRLEPTRRPQITRLVDMAR
jgi:hypothetical protein